MDKSALTQSVKRDRSEAARKAHATRAKNARVAAIKKTARWAFTMTRQAISLARGKGRRWEFATFLGPGGRESRGIVDIVAIRKNQRFEGDGFGRGDLFEIILIQVKGGTSRRPGPEDLRRLTLVRERYRASATLLASWEKGRAPTFEVLNAAGEDWETTTNVERLFR